MEKKFYTKKEAAEVLGVNPKTIERYLLSGKLKGAKFGTGQRGVWKISEDDIQEFYNAVKRETAKNLKSKK